MVTAVYIFHPTAVVKREKKDGRTYFSGKSASPLGSSLLFPLKAIQTLKSFGGERRGVNYANVFCIVLKLLEEFR